MYACARSRAVVQDHMGNVLTLTPPLTISEAEMLQAVDSIAAAIEEAQAELA